MIKSHKFGPNGLEFYIDGQLAARWSKEKLIQGLAKVIEEQAWKASEDADEFHFGHPLRLTEDMRCDQ